MIRGVTDLKSGGPLFKTNQIKALCFVPEQDS